MSRYVVTFIALLSLLVGGRSSALLRLESYTSTLYVIAAGRRFGPEVTTRSPELELLLAWRHGWPPGGLLHHLKLLVCGGAHPEVDDVVDAEARWAGGDAECVLLRSS